MAAADAARPGAAPGAGQPHTQRMNPATAARDIAGITGRNLRRLVRTPQLLVFTAVQPAMMLLLFRYALGGAIRIPGMKYVDFVVPAIFLEAVLVGFMATSIGLAQDIGGGIVDRFRSLPMARSAVLAGRTLADLCRSIFSLALMVGLGVLVGFRFHANWLSALAGLGIALVFGYAFCWIYATLGLLTRDPETAQVAGILPFFILVFASTAFVPVQTMPGWLQWFARNQPVSHTIDLMRALFHGGPVVHSLWLTLLWSLGIFLAFFLASIRLYRHLSA
ncbi:ABC transporter permease [Streptomyces hoynatensis]|uniref:Transport permease protein n=1 Tax=Streptomyces hoynatensis TaxID=1141874 RepID=A0A3A9YYT8_9ACTN|nr:ABC transporter permease [Streptomyces hoynatensis]RKN41241.1 ABC transporter permease [Streptomyces hoynatensis]